MYLGAEDDSFLLFFMELIGEEKYLAFVCRMIFNAMSEKVNTKGIYKELFTEAPLCLHERGLSVYSFIREH